MSKHDREVLRTLAPPPASHVWRIAAATFRGFTTGRSPAEMLKAMYPEDIIAPLILARAASTQATLTDPAWAEPLAHIAVSDAVEDIVAMSALDNLDRSGALRIDMGRNASVVVPGRMIDPTTAINMWVGEGQAVPVMQYDLLGNALHVHKIEVNVVVTRELSEASNIDAILRKLLTEMGGLAIDAAVLSTNAASAQCSAGILNGLTPMTPTAGATGIDACGQDLGTLAGDIATRGGGRFMCYVASPKQATAIRFWAGGQFSLTPNTDSLPIAASAVLPEGTVVGIEPTSLAFSFGTPTFAVSKVAALHMDSAPAIALLTKSPVKSMWQVDAIVLKMTLWGDFCMRAPHVAYMDAVAW